ncbi:hypothetical protein IE81DRAFT_323386 [Ceraceosorus guamensis]|uniref:F-box domain-containing protein n=1 Tax=Ceraceosorus guamensis TaxID=1522189 RepID=A0A316VZY0_9BASI|nr:hypothetical protein IE81DRAFT_323386 [Ceraceosorus guamensis]PWN42428.1 hypothetical protein IE81DRAFT_323386 [Ceraceosorus guamensis]
MFSAGQAALLDLPEEVIVDGVLPHLEEADLHRLGLVNKSLHRLTNDQALWHRLLLRDFNFPRFATARVNGWKSLYIGLTRPEIWTCGEDSDGRLGVGRELYGGIRNGVPSLLSRLINYEGGAPFPLQTRWRDACLAKAYHSEQDPRALDSYLGPNPKFELLSEASVSLGAPVELHAAGWSFAALTSTGNVLLWGTIRTMDMPARPVTTPTVLDLGYASTNTNETRKRRQARLLAAGTALVAVTTQNECVVWHDPKYPTRLDDVFDLDQPAHIKQVVSGGGHTVLLTGSETVSDAERDSRALHSRDLDHRDPPRIYMWLNNWTDLHETDLQGFHAEHDPADDTSLLVKPSRSFRLPSLPPEPPAELLLPHERAQFGSTAFVLDPEHPVQIAAGENVVYALSQRGLVYKLDVEEPRTPLYHQEAGTDSDDSDDSAAGRMYSDAEERLESLRGRYIGEYASRRRVWQLLRGFCDPEMIRKAGEGSGNVWDLPHTRHLLSDDTRITHLSAAFRSFVAYSVDSSGSGLLYGEPSSSAKRGIVLQGRYDATSATLPQLKPELQGQGIIKVTCGDYHFGALDETGRVRTWGQWSKGARGTWDEYPLVEGRNLPFGAGEEDAAGGVQFGRAMRNRGPGIGFRIGLAGARGRAPPLPRASAPDPAPSQNPSSNSASRPSKLQRLEQRCRLRNVTSATQDTPTFARFEETDVEDANEGGHHGLKEEKERKFFVFDIAMAGWHTGALSVDLHLLA